MKIMTFYITYKRNILIQKLKNISSGINICSIVQKNMQMTVILLQTLKIVARALALKVVLADNKWMVSPRHRLLAPCRLCPQRPRVQRKEGTRTKWSGGRPPACSSWRTQSRLSSCSSESRAEGSRL